jgi:hypothetical protein
MILYYYEGNYVIKATPRETQTFHQLVKNQIRYISQMAHEAPSTEQFDELMANQKQLIAMEAEIKQNIKTQHLV